MKISHHTRAARIRAADKSEARTIERSGGTGWGFTALAVWLAASGAVVVVGSTYTNHPSNRAGWFVVVASAVLMAISGFVLLFVRHGTVVSPALTPWAPQSGDAFKPLSKAAMLASSAMLLGGLVCGYWLGWILVEDSVRSRLVDVASIQRSLLQAWIQGERGDVQHWAAHPLFGPEVTLREDQSTAPEALLQQVRVLGSVAKERNFEGITLRDPATGKRWVTTSSEPDGPADIAEALSLARSPPPHEGARVALPDARSGPQTALKIFQMMVATAGGQQAVLQVDIAVEDLFLRHIGMAMEPVPDSLHTLLVQRTAGGVVIHNDTAVRGHILTLRHVDGPPPGSVWAALKDQQDQGFARGIGGSGESVLAYAVPVEGTRWVLVTQIDESRILGKLNLIFLGVSAVVGCGLLMATWWWQGIRRQSLASSRLASERARLAEQIAELSHQVVSAQEAERHRLAMELHDHIGADLAAISLNLKFIERNFGNVEAEVGAVIHETNGLLGNTVLTIRDLCTQLRPSVLDHAGLQAALHTSAHQLKRRTGLEVDISVQGVARKRSAALELAIFRIVQEAMLNCERHAAARNLRLELREDDAGLRMTIEDDGQGFDPAALGKDGKPLGHGISNMRDRATLEGGIVHIWSAPGQGTRVQFFLPGR
jgi:signal transduction histidine kinase